MEQPKNAEELKLQEDIIGQLKAGLLKTRTDCVDALEKGGIENTDAIINSDKFWKAVKDTISNLLLISDSQSAQSLMVEFGILKETMAVELSLNPQLSNIVAYNIHELGEGVNNLQNLALIFGESFLRHVPIIGEVKKVLLRLIASEKFGALKQCEAFGLSHDDVEDIFIDAFKNSTSLLGTFDDIPGRYFEKLNISDKFFKDEGVVEIVTVIYKGAIEGGELDTLKNIKEKYKINLKQEDFQTALAALSQKSKSNNKLEARFLALKQYGSEQGFDMEFLEPGFSKKVALKEGFVESADVDGPRAAVFSAMKAGEYKLLHHPTGEVEADPTKKDFVHTVLYRTPDGACLEKKLDGKFGWTSFAARSLTEYMNKETTRKTEGDGNKEYFKSKDTLVRQNGFEEVSLDKQSSSRQAVLKNMIPGQFVSLSYPEGEIAADISKRGMVHCIVYKDSYGRAYEKRLNGDQYKNGWTDFEAKSLVKGIEEAQG